MTDGRQAERHAVDRYQEAGYQVYLPPKAKYREQDVFGLFDLLAFGHDRLEAVQVKAGRDATGIKAWFRDARVFEERLTDLRVSFLHHKANEWRVARTAPDGYQWVYDARETPTGDADRLLEVLRA